MREQRNLMLLVEDTAEDELALLRLVKESGLDMKVKILRHGTEALEYFFADKCDSRCMPMVVLMDMNLPRVHGLEVLKALKSDERTKSLPVTMMTNGVTPLLMSESRRLGAEDCVSKPLSQETLQDIVARAWYLSRYR